MRACDGCSSGSKVFPFLMMKVIREPSQAKTNFFQASISLPVERRVLAKRRWRGQAMDGTDFGFDLQAPLRHGICFHAEKEKTYVIEQKPEEVFGYLTLIIERQHIGHGKWETCIFPHNLRIPTCLWKGTWPFD